MRSEYKVQMNKDSLRTFSVLFYGPKDTAYEGGVWKVPFPPFFFFIFLLFYGPKDTAYEGGVWKVPFPPFFF